MTSKESKSRPQIGLTDKSAFTKVSKVGRGSSDDPADTVASSSSSSSAEMLLKLRMSPHLAEDKTQIMVECSPDHPFFVRDRGEFVNL